MRTPGPSRPLLAAALDLIPLALLVAAAAARPLRLPVLVLLVVGAATASQWDRRRLPAWAGALPVAVSLAWALVEMPASARDGTTCADPAAPFATYRIVEAALTLATVAVIARAIGGGGEELGLRRPSAGWTRLGIAGLALCGALGIVLGPSLARPFFGDIHIRTDDLGALVPAAAFALSNGVMEEVIYRGSLRAWTARVTGPWPAIVGQAIVFGVAHSGADFTGSALPVAVAMAAGGLVAGLVVRASGSLFVPIMIHVGLDIPLYYGNACRVA